MKDQHAKFLRKEELELAYSIKAKELYIKYPYLLLNDDEYKEIALNNALLTSWRKVLNRPPLQNLPDGSLEIVVDLLEAYKNSEALLVAHYKKSQQYRELSETNV
ncbi:MAG: hypothetical protein AAF789_08730 [Bacteroidota bacterium]